MTTLLDLAPAIAFFIAYSMGGIYTATLVLIISMAAALLLHYLLYKHWHKGHLIGTVVASVLGGITLAIHDPAFIKLKPTIVYAVFALALLGSHFVGEKVLLQRLPQQLLVMPDGLWRRINFAWVLFFIFCAGLNYVVAHRFDEATWVKLKAFGFSLLMMLFLLAHLPFVSRYMADTTASGKEG